MAPALGLLLLGGLGGWQWQRGPGSCCRSLLPGKVGLPLAEQETPALSVGMEPIFSFCKTHTEKGWNHRCVAPRTAARALPRPPELEPVCPPPSPVSAGLGPHVHTWPAPARHPGCQALHVTPMQGLIFLFLGSDPLFPRMPPSVWVFC